MEGSVGAAETNCESDKHVKCPKCSTTGDKHFPQPIINEKHKQKNQEILERKQKLANAGRRMSRKISEAETHHLPAKLALERQQQKKVEVFDSHAIDFTAQYKEADDQSDIFLPRHLKKRQSSQLLNLNKVKVENNAGKRQTSQTAADDNENETENGEGENVLEVLRNVEDLRRASLAYGFLEPQRNSPQHDTLQAYFKFRKENMVKEDRLKKVQAKARLREEDVAANSLTISRKPIGSRNVLPPLRKLNSETKLGTKTNATELNRVHYKERANRERHGKLPKISRKKSKARDGNTGSDPRFQKLISCLVPLSEKTGMSPPFTRKRHYTM